VDGDPIGSPGKCQYRAYDPVSVQNQKAFASYPTQSIGKPATFKSRLLNLKREIVPDFQEMIGCMAYSRAAVHRKPGRNARVRVTVLGESPRPARFAEGFAQMSHGVA
jgi:hypothetical protein